jgi:hypothetical protein
MDVPDIDLAVWVNEIQLDGTKVFLTEDWGQVRTCQTGNLDAGTCHWSGGTVRDGGEGGFAHPTAGAVGYPLSLVRRRADFINELLTQDTSDRRSAL